VKEESVSKMLQGYWQVETEVVSNCSFAKFEVCTAVNIEFVVFDCISIIISSFTATSSFQQETCELKAKLSSCLTHATKTQPVLN